MVSMLVRREYRENTRRATVPATTSMVTPVTVVQHVLLGVALTASKDINKMPFMIT